MRKAGFGLFLILCVGVVLFLWQQTGRKETRARRGPPATAEPPEAPADPGEASSGLAVEDGVAQAPDFQDEVVPGLSRRSAAGAKVDAAVKAEGRCKEARRRQLQPQPAESSRVSKHSLAS